ncbi:MAG TPA: chemotaxis protein CheA [Thermoanaerobaculia bacterium]
MSETLIRDIDRQQLVDVFVVESEETLASLEELLLRLEHAPEDQDILNEIFRGAHTLKGNASCLQFDELSGFAHVVEEMLERLRTGDLHVSPTRISQLLDAVDTLRDLSARSVAGGERSLLANQRALLAELSESALHSLSDGQQKSEHGAEKTSSERGTRSSRSLRVGIEKLDRMLDLTGEIAIARGHVRLLMSGDHGTEAIFDAIRELDRLSLDLQELVMNARLVPVGPALRRFHRVVRDVAATAGKRVSLVIEGDEVEVDTTVIEQLKDPITHMIRNSIDHGIERPEERTARGKAATATIRISASHESGGVVFRFADDGRGLDEVRIAGRARAMSIDVERLSREDILGLIFQPGFSTAHEVTEVSGRGIGMDVVRRNVELLRGTVSVASVAGTGTTIMIRLPLTVALIEGFGVAVGDETYIVPIDAIAECMELPAGTPPDARGVLNLRGEPLPFVRLGHLFDIPTTSPVRENVVVIHHQRGRAGLVVQELLGGSQSVMKPMGHLLRGVAGLAGSSILGNGRVALILDPHEIVRRAAEPPAA